MVLRELLPEVPDDWRVAWEPLVPRARRGPWRALGFGSAAVLLGWVGWSVLAARRVEEPRFEVLGVRDGVELRRYAPQLAAVTEVVGGFRASLDEGFRRLAGFIFGGNFPREPIAMTAPVSHQRRGKGAWRVTFVMPSKYSLGTLPRPVDARVRVEPVPERTRAVLRFSGWAREGRAERRKAELLDRVRGQGLRTVGEPVLAQYHPPWTLPFLRRNEVLVDIAP